MSLVVCPDCQEKVYALPHKGCKRGKGPMATGEREGTPEAQRPYSDVLGSVAAVKRRGRPVLHNGCSICGKPHWARGMCKNHYQQWRNRERGITKHG